MRPIHRNGDNERKRPSTPRSGCTTETITADTASAANRKPPWYRASVRSDIRQNNHSV